LWNWCRQLRRMRRDVCVGLACGWSHAITERPSGHTHIHTQTHTHTGCNYGSPNDNHNTVVAQFFKRGVFDSPTLYEDSYTDCVKCVCVCVWVKYLVKDSSNTVQSPCSQSWRRTLSLRSACSAMEIYTHSSTYTYMHTCIQCPRKYRYLHIYTYLLTQRILSKNFPKVRGRAI